MDIASLIVGALLGAGIVAGVTLHLKRDLVTAQSHLIEMQGAAIQSLARKLEALRDACFLTNEHGHRVRYWKASEQVRAKAEA